MHIYDYIRIQKPPSPRPLSTSSFFETQEEYTDPLISSKDLKPDLIDFNIEYTAHLTIK